MPLADLLSHARRSPERIALVHNGTAWSYAALARAIADARSRLAGAGWRPGGLGAVAADGLVDAWVATFALRSLGVTTIAVDRGMDLPTLGLGTLSGVVTVEGERSDAAEAYARQAGCGALRLPAARLSAFARGPVPEALPSAPAPLPGHVLLTSGTTGAFKKVLREPGAEEASTRAFAPVYGLSADSVVFMGNFPLWTAGGFRWPRIAWCAGATVVYEDSRELHRPLGQPGLTHAFATPAMLAAWLEAPEGAIRRDDALRLLVTAGPLPRDLAGRTRARLTGQVYTSYASTEASSVTMTCIGSDDDLFWHRPLASREIQVVDESGRALPAGEEGLVRVRAAAGIDGYLDDEAATREFFRDGWFYPGDLGRLGADGRLCLHGRVTDVINLLGRKLATGPLERALQERLGAGGVCVFADQDEQAGEEVHVAIESRAPVDKGALAAFAQDELGAFPRVRFHVVAELPRNAMGKIRRQELRRQLLARG